MGRIRVTLGVAALLCAACYEGPSGNGDSSNATEFTASAGDDTGVQTGPGSGGPECIPGQEGCICLEANCVGALYCVNDECVPGPEFGGIDDINVIAGVRLQIELEIMADSLSWSQTGGPTADRLAGQDGSTLQVDVPPGANDGSQMVLTLTATRNSIEASEDYVINVMPADFSNFTSEITDPMEAGTVEGLDIRDVEAWVISTEGFVSRINSEGGFVERIDIPGGPIGGRFGGLPDGDNDDIDVMFIANALDQRVEAMILNTEEIRMISSAAMGGGMLGAVDYVLPRDNELWFSNREGGQIFYSYFEGDTGNWITSEFAADVGTNPNALSFGMNDGYLYVGTVGRVWRVPILDGSSGPPEPYLNLGPQTDLTLEVEGIEFDNQGTMYVGVPGTNSLHMARYVANGQTEVVRSFTNVGAAINAFVNVQFGEGDFGGATLYWTNPGTGNVGRLPVGVGGQD